MIVIAIISGISALFLSGSRGGVIAFISMVIIWAIYISKKKRVSLKFFLTSLILMVLLSGAITYYFFPDVKAKFVRSSQYSKSFSIRVGIWKPLIYAAAERPVFGWGYGGRIFKIDLPFKNTPFKVSPFKHNPQFGSTHNTFLYILFHQGIVGLILYIPLLIIAIITFWRSGHNTVNVKSYILTACVSILISTYIVNSLTSTIKLTSLNLILAIGLAAINLKDENSHN